MSLQGFVALLRPIAMAGANVIMVMVVLPVLYLLEPIFPIRITHWATERMGHLAGDIHLYRARRFLNPEREKFYRISLGAYPCNQALLDIWKRYLPINENRWLSRFWHYCKNTLAKTRFHRDETQSTDIHYEYAKFTDYPKFTAEEEQRGRRLLEQMGVGADDWFVTFHVRDNAYQKFRFPDWQEPSRSQNRQVRNGTIMDYLPAAQMIAEMGGFAVRVGHMTAEPLAAHETSRIIDYSYRFRSDFGDVYLAAKCRFFLGGPSGLPQLSTIFGVPVALASMVPLCPHPVGPKALFSPVLIRDRTSGEILHYRRARELGLFDNRAGHQWRDNHYDDRGLEVVRNTPKDIRDLAHDMLDQIAGKPVGDEAKRLQDIYRFRYANIGKGFEFAPTIAPRFALKYRHLIDE
jgi:putative glycosyltransferase (TIGR04372 family)